MTIGTQNDQEQHHRLLAGKEGEQLLFNFFSLYKTSRLVEENNATFIRQSEQFFNSLKNYQKQHGEITIKLIAGRFFINDKMVRFDDKGLSGADSVKVEWDMLGIGGVLFEADISQPDVDQYFIHHAHVKPSSENIEILSEKLKNQRMQKVQVLSQQKIRESDAVLTEEMRREMRTNARNTFFKAMTVVQEVVVNTQKDKDVNISKTKRVVHALIDHISRDESSLIELASIKDFDDYTYAHSTNVAVYSLTLGVRLGLDRARLSQLGFTALFHDIGKVKLPTDLIRKPDAFDENDWIQMQLHPQLGAKTILRNLKFDIHIARAARGAFEHHINNDFTGYPQLKLEKRPHNLYSKIISIVDTFDALSSGRIYLKKSIPPEKVLKKMQYQMTVKFDAFLLKIFNDIIGIYPAGTLVLLTTDEIALVLTNHDTDKNRPYVKIVGNKDGLIEEPLWVDLSLPENDERRIVRKIDPDRYGLNIKDFILEN